MGERFNALGLTTVGDGAALPGSFAVTGAAEAPAFYLHDRVQAAICRERALGPLPDHVLHKQIAWGTPPSV